MESFLFDKSNEQKCFDQKILPHALFVKVNDHIDRIARRIKKNVLCRVHYAAFVTWPLSFVGHLGEWV